MSIEHTHGEPGIAHSYADPPDVSVRAYSPNTKSDTQRVASSIASSIASAVATPAVAQESRSIFQQSWWLDCATGGEWAEATVRKDGRTVGWLPYSVSRRWGFAISNMPLLTHTLGPIVAAGTGRPSTQLLNRFTIVTELLQQLPRLAHLRQVLPPEHAEALAWQACGCHVKSQFTFISDCTDMAAAWRAMRDKTRNLIRRAQDKDTVSADADPQDFLRLYADNCSARRQVNRYENARTRELLQQCVARDQGRALLSRQRSTGKLNAGIFVVWDSHCMYFLMSTRAAANADSGAVSQLLWLAMQEAHRRGLKFDFDGVSSAGTFRFLSGFGGTVATRFAVEKFTWTYHSMDKLRALVYGNAQQPFD